MGHISQIAVKKLEYFFTFLFYFLCLKGLFLHVNSTINLFEF